MPKRKLTTPEKHPKEEQSSAKPAAPVKPALVADHEVAAFLKRSNKKNSKLWAKLSDS